MSQISLKKFGSTIQKQRKSKDLSTEKLAEKLGVSVGLISNIEHGKTAPFKLDLLINLLNTLDISYIQIAPDKALQISESSIKPSDNKIETAINNKTLQHSEIIRNEINSIIDAFIKIIYENDYNPEKIKILSKHIVNEFNFLEKINK